MRIDQASTVIMRAEDTLSSHIRNVVHQDPYHIGELEPAINEAAQLWAGWLNLQEGNYVSDMVYSEKPVDFARFIPENILDKISINKGSAFESTTTKADGWLIEWKAERGQVFKNVRQDSIGRPIPPKGEWTMAYLQYALRGTLTATRGQCLSSDGHFLTSTFQKEGSENEYEITHKVRVGESVRI